MAGLTKMARHEERTAYLFLLPWIIGFILFSAGPLIASFVISFTEWPILSAPKWIGLENFFTMVDDPLFWQSLKITAIYTAIGVPMGLIAGFFVALMLNQKIRAVSWWRAIYYMPAVVAGVVVARMWQGVFNPIYGILNSLLSFIGITGPNWLGQEEWVLPAFLIMALWNVAGANMVIYLAGLQSIPSELYEAAMIDGAGAWQKLLNVTIPLMTPVIFLRLIMGIIGAFQVFTQAFVMTKGGPGSASLFYVLYIYRNAFEYSKMGYASALAWVLFVIILILTWLFFRSSGGWVFYQGELRK